MKKNLLLLLCFLVIPFCLRFFSFFPTVLNHDESTYMVIGHEIFRNHKILYHDVIDVKPPGIFLIFGLVGQIAGSSIFVIRLFTSVLVSITAYLLMLSCLKWHQNRKASVASGFIYIFFVSTWEFFGMSINTELYFTFFNILGLYLLVQRKSYFYFLSGLAFGTGFIVKFSNLFDFIPIVLYFIIYLNIKKRKLSTNLLNLIICGIGFLLPFIITNLYFLAIGHYKEFSFITYYVPLHYNSSTDWTGILNRLKDLHAYFIPIFFFFYFVLFRKNVALREIKIFILFWLFFDLLSIFSLGNDFPHYFIQLMPPVAILAGFFFTLSIQMPDFLKKIPWRQTGLILLVLAMIIKLFTDRNEYYLKKDYTHEIAAYLKQNTTKNDVIYTGNYYQILYLLTDKESPTPR